MTTESRNGVPLSGLGASPASPRTKANILLVDDRPDGLSTLRALLEDLDENLYTAGSGREALAFLLARDFAVILLDIRMPDMDGFETATLIRSRPRSKHTPIIFVTGLDESSGNLERVYRVGAVDCLWKPFIPEVLRSKVRFFLELHRKNEALEEARSLLELENAERRRAEEERNRAQAELLQGQKLQATGQLAAGIAHEINNPTSYILSNLSTLQRYLRQMEPLVRAGATVLSHEPARTGGPEGTGVESSTQKEVDFLLEDFGNALVDCRSGAERIRIIVRGLREFIHPDESLLKETDLSALLDSAAELCSNELKYQARLHREYAKLPPVTCNAGQIEQVFVNLLVNAAQALGPARGDVHLSTREEPGGVVVSIRDSGPGIPQETFPKLFLPFFTTKPVGKGTGLGLHVAYKIVRAHGGSIEVRSEEGKGAEFLVHLPCKPSLQATA